MMVALPFRVSRAAEYRADALGARLASTEDVLGVDHVLARGLVCLAVRGIADSDHAARPWEAFRTGEVRCVAHPIDGRELTVVATLVTRHELVDGLLS